MTKQQFKRRWESDAEGGGITFDDVAQCAVEWGLFAHPKTCEMNLVLRRVLLAAEINGAEMA